MPIVSCQVCKKSFYVKPSHQLLGWGKYCSANCRSKSQLKGKTFLCGVCGKKLYRSPAKIVHSHSGNFFCSKRCQTLWRNKYYIEEKSPLWQNGITVYRKILERSGVSKICKICLIDNPKVLSVHHVDHNRNNNTLKNLTWLCFNCHFLIHHDEVFEAKFTKRQN